MTPIASLLAPLPPRRPSFTTPADHFTALKKKIQVRRDPPQVPNAYLAPGGLPWVRIGLYLDREKNWTRAELAVFNVVNRAIQFKTRGGKITVREIMKYTGLSERAVYVALRKLKDRG